MAEKKSMKERRAEAAERALEHRKEAMSGVRYTVGLNKGSLNVGGFQKLLNERWKNGYKLAHLIEQHGNTLMVFEQRDD